MKAPSTWRALPLAPCRDSVAVGPGSGQSSELAALGPVFVEAVGVQDHRPGGVDAGHQLMAILISLIGMVSFGQPK